MNLFSSSRSAVSRSLTQFAIYGSIRTYFGNGCESRRRIRRTPCLPRLSRNLNRLS